MLNVCTERKGKESTRAALSYIQVSDKWIIPTFQQLLDNTLMAIIYWEFETQVEILLINGRKQIPRCVHYN